MTCMATFFSSKKMTMRKFWCAVHVLCKNPGVAGLYLEAETRQILESIYFCGFSFQFGEMHAFPFPLINEKHRVLCTQSVSLKPVDGQLVWSRVTVGLHSKTHLSAPLRAIMHNLYANLFKISPDSFISIKTHPYIC